jgi:hypothetical protein
MPCILDREDMNYFNGKGLLCGSSIEVFLHSIKEVDIHDAMKDALIVPSEFYQCLSSFYTHYNFEAPCTWSDYFSLGFVEHPMLFTVNTSNNGVHWLNVFINQGKLTIIDPYMLGVRFQKIEENLQSWYKTHDQLLTGSIPVLLEVIYRIDDFPSQDTKYATQCWVLCALYQYYQLTLNRWPTTEDFEYSDWRAL